MDDIIGIDECGRGAIFGPVVACAVSTHFSALPLQITDSKKLTHNKRIEIMRQADPYLDMVGFGVVPPDVIDKVNIRNASILAMKRAYKKVARPGCTVYIDGVDGIGVAGEIVVPHGDLLIPWISLASIICKVYRDNLMVGYSKSSAYKEYSLERNKGYLTREHIIAIRKFGLSDIHRKSYTIPSL